MSGLNWLLELLRSPFLSAHYGYEPDEVPKYANCPYGCGMVVRADRTDLLIEHFENCSNYPYQEN